MIKIVVDPEKAQNRDVVSPVKGVIEALVKGEPHHEQDYAR
jgi:hypothetical protein